MRLFFKCILTTIISFPGGIRWDIILGVMIPICVIVFLAILYFCRCCNWTHRETEMWKKVDDNLVIARTDQIGGGPDVCPGGNGKGGGGMRKGNGAGSAADAATVPGVQIKKPSYHRVGSKESAEVSHSCFFSVNRHKKQF